MAERKPIEYWRCPRGDVAISIRFDALDTLGPFPARIMRDFGLDWPAMTTTDPWLWNVLPQAWLEEAEDAVEQHELMHLQGVA